MTVAASVISSPAPSTKIYSPFSFSLPLMVIPMWRSQRSRQWFGAVIVYWVPSGDVAGTSQT